MPTFLAHATLPDGTYAMLGDTVRRPAAKIPGTYAEFAATTGRTGPRPPTPFAKYNAGFAFGRTGWGERRAYRDEAMYSLRFGPGRRFHGHADHGSVTLYGYGKRLIDDSGTFTLNFNRWHAFAIGRTAHNVVTVDGVSYRASSSAPLAWARSGVRRDDLTVTDRGYSGVTLRRRVVFSRNVGYLVVEDRASAQSSRTFRQLWHLDVGTAPVVGGRTVRSTRASGNVRIDPAGRPADRPHRQGPHLAGPGLDLRDVEPAAPRAGRRGGGARAIRPLPDPGRADSRPERPRFRHERPALEFWVEFRHRRRRRPRARAGDRLEFDHHVALARARGGWRRGDSDPISTAQSAPMIRNGPNGMKLRRPIRRVARSTSSTTPARTSPNSVPPSARSPPTIRPIPASNFTSPIPNAPAPNGIDSRYSTAGIAQRRGPPAAARRRRAD